MKINVEMEYDELKEFMDFKKDNKSAKQKLIDGFQLQLKEFEVRDKHTMNGYQREMSFLKELIVSLKKEVTK
jgi:hypothetical protein